MDALVKPKDYIALSYHVEVLPYSLLQALMGGGKLFAKIAGVAWRIYKIAR